MKKRQIGSQILKGLLDTLVLQILNRGDNYGFGILQEITAQLDGDNYLLREATLYPLLYRLESKSYVESYWRPGERGTDRKYYRITKQGRSYMEERVADWRKVAGILNKTVLKIEGEP